MAKKKTPASLIPFGKLNEKHYTQKHIDIRLDSHQANNLKRLAVGLDGNQARLSNQRRVVNAPDALRWLLENLDEIVLETSGASGASD